MRGGIDIARHTCFGHVLIRSLRRAQGGQDVPRDERREARAQHGQPRVCRRAHLNHLEGDVLPLKVAVQPQ